MICNRWYLTKNPNVKLLELLSYTRVKFWTIREVNWNDMDSTTVLLFWRMEGSEGGRGGKGEELGRYVRKGKVRDTKTQLS